MYLNIWKNYCFVFNMSIAIFRKKLVSYVNRKLNKKKKSAVIMKHTKTQK